MDEHTTNGIKFTSFQMGGLGTGVILFSDTEHTDPQITAALAELQAIPHLHCVRIASEDDRDMMYQHEIISQPGINGLPWYQINTDPELIRRERIKGTSAEEYVKTYVLPFLKETEENYLQRFGEQIYEV